MLEKMRLAARRVLTAADLFENLAAVYGEREALSFAGPAEGRPFPSARVGFRDCLRFTNLAAEALIRDLDLKKGERVALLVDDPGELLLVSLAAVKAGGIAVPLDARLGAEEVRRRAEGCGATLALADGASLARLSGPSGLPGEKGRLMACGPREALPPGVASLREAAERSSGFFIPYTLKPGSVVALFHREAPPGRTRAVMATSGMLTGTRRVAALLPAFRPGGRFLNALATDSMAWLAASFMALLSGMRLSFSGESPDAAAEALEREMPEVFAASPGLYSGMLDAGMDGIGTGSVRLWTCWGHGLKRGEAAKLGDAAMGRSGLPAPLLEVCDGGGNAVMLGLRVSVPGRPWPRNGISVAIPPNRIRLERGSDEGETPGGARALAIRGPAVTPGYWNDLEGTLEAWKGGWLRCGPVSAVGVEGRPCGHRWIRKDAL